MPSPMNGPCSPFITELDVCCLVSGMTGDPCLTDGQPVSQTVIDNSLQVASEILWAGTGRQYGICDTIVNPCWRDDCNLCEYTEEVGYPWIPVLKDAVWTNVKCFCTDSCECTKRMAVSLPYPVNEVTTVTIDGVELLDTNYHVEDFRYLVRTDGEPWPKCQDNWSVTMSYGREPTALVKMATGALACELIKSCTPGASCELPKRMQSLTRQGVTVGFIDPQTFFEQGLTGIYIVDLALKSVNPNRLQKQASVYSPDMANKWRRAGT